MSRRHTTSAPGTTSNKSSLPPHIEGTLTLTFDLLLKSSSQGVHGVREAAEVNSLARRLVGHAMRGADGPWQSTSEWRQQKKRMRLGPVSAPSSDPNDAMTVLLVTPHSVGGAVPHSMAGAVPQSVGGAVPHSMSRAVPHPQYRALETCTEGAGHQAESLRDARRQGVLDAAFARVQDEWADMTWDQRDTVHQDALRQLAEFEVSEERKTAEKPSGDASDSPSRCKHTR